MHKTAGNAAEKDSALISLAKIGPIFFSKYPLTGESGKKLT